MIWKEVLQNLSSLLFDCFFTPQRERERERIKTIGDDTLNTFCHFGAQSWDVPIG
jgi:hypothetical protein